MTMTKQQCSARLHQGLVPAVPVPFTAAGEIDAVAQERYIAHMAQQPIAGAAVWAHTGRGLHLDAARRKEVLRAWDAGLGPEKLLIAGAGGSPRMAKDPEQYLSSALRMADDALENGADALLAYSPFAYRDADQRDGLIVEYHRQLAKRGAPIILFYLYEAAGGISYSHEVLRELFALPEVVGIKIATLDSVMTFQDISSMIRRDFPDTMLITGEDRFMGYSLMCGAQSALVGMGATCTQLQWEMMNAWFQGRSGEFIELSRRVDLLSQLLFVAPMEGYIRRTLQAMAHEGVIGKESSYDPFGPALPEQELRQIPQRLQHLIHDYEGAR